MPLPARTVTRRAFLTAPAVLALAQSVLPKPAQALVSPSIPTSPERSLAEAAVISTKSAARDGFFRVPWLPRLFESDLLVDDSLLFRDTALRAASVVANGAFHERNFSKLQFIAAPKNKHGAHRIFAIMEPVDAVSFLILALLAAPAIEARKVPAAARIVHSYRFRPEAGGLFDRDFTFATFLAAASSRAEKEGFIVSCDFANCYGNLHHTHIAAALERSGVVAWQVNYVAELLAFWQTEKSRGLPVGSYASNILAEAALLQIDKSLGDADVDFVRYVDDFRIFAPDEAGARQAVAALAEAAAPWGLSLNPDKTKIVRFVNAEEGSLGKTSTSGIAQYRTRTAQDASLSRKKTYGQILPINFRRAGIGEIGRLRRGKWRPNAAAFLDSSPVPYIRLRRAIRRAIYTGHWEFVHALPAILNRYPEFGSYVASALRQTSSFIPAGVRDGLKGKFAAVLLSPTTPDFVAIKLVDILSHPAYRARRVLEHFAQARAVDPRGLCFRWALDALRNTGGLMPEFSEHFVRMDGWGKRAVVADPSARALLNLPPGNNDPFIAKLTSVTRGPRSVT